MIPTPALPDVTEEFHADSGPYVAALRAMEAAADAAAAANERLAAAVKTQQDAMDTVVASASEAAASTDRFAEADRTATTASDTAAEAAASLARDVAQAAAAEDEAAHAAARLAMDIAAAAAETDHLRDSFTAETATAATAAEVLDELGVDEERLAAMAGIAAGALTRLNDATAMFAASETAAADAAGGATAALAGQAAVTTGKTASTDALAGAVAKMAAAEEAAKLKAEASAVALAAEAAAARAAAASDADLAKAALLLGVSEETLSGALHATADDADASETAMRSLAEAASILGVSDKTLAAAMGSVTTAADEYAMAAGKATKSTLTLGNLFAGGIWGKGAGTTWHYLIDWAIEFGAVLVPATIAVAAFGLAAARTADAIVTHFQAVLPVVAATGQSFAPVTGQLNQLSTALAPDVLQMYGDTLQVVSAKAGAFGRIASQTGSVLDTWAARATMDLRNSATATGLLSHGAADLNGLLQVLANTFGALGNLMRAAMITHIAEDFLFLFEAASKVLDVVTRLPAPILATVLALHGVWLWGKLGIATFNSLAGAATGAATSLIGLGVKWGFLGDGAIAVAGKLGASVEEMAAMGTAAEATGAETGLLAGSMNVLKAIPVWGWAAAGAVALGALVFAITRVQSATQQWGAQLQATIDKASLVNGMNVLFASISKVSTALAHSDAQLAQTQKFTVNLRTGLEQTTTAYAGLAMKQQQQTALQQHLNDEAREATKRLGGLAGQYGGMSQAIGLASLAGIKWKNVLHDTDAEWKVAQQQVAATAEGYRMMGQSGSGLANDVNAVTFSIEMQDSKVQQLNQGWQAFLGVVTGGESSFLSFEQQMNGLTAAAGGLGAKLKISNGAASASATATGAAASGADKAKVSFNGLSASNINLRQSFQQTISAASSYLQSITSMGAASANGAQGEKLISQASRDVVAQMIPLASRSQATRAELYALAQEAGFHGVNSMKALSQWVGPGGVAGHERDLNRVTSQLTGSVSNLTRDVNNLGSALGINLNSAMAKSVMLASGVTGAMNSVASDLMNTGTSATKSAGDVRAWTQDMLKMGESPKQAAEQLSVLTEQIMRGKASMLGSHAPAMTMVTDLASIGNKAHLSTGQIAGLITKATGLPHQEVMNILMQLNGHTAGPGDYHRAGSDVGTGMAAGVRSSTPAATSAAGAMAHGVVARAQSARGQMQSAGASVAQGFVGGIESMFGSVAAAASRLVSSLGGTVEHLLGIHSPSTVFHKYGLDTVQGLIDGLTANESKIKSTIANILGGIKKMFQAGAISAGQDSALVRYVKADNAKLQRLAAERKKIAAQISAAKTYDQNLKQALTGSAGLTGLAAVQNASATSPLTGAGILSGLKADLSAIQNFGRDIQKLKKLGLDKNLLNQIIQAGPVQGSQIAEAILKAVGSQEVGGKGPHGGTPGHLPSIIDQLNATQAAITKASGQVASQATKAMFDSGEAMGKGMVAGLKKQEKAIEKEMEHIADVLVKRLKKDLKISSPSIVMVQHGLMIAQGLAQGIALGQPMVETAMRAMAAMVSGSKLTVPPVRIATAVAAGGGGTPGHGGTPPVPLGPGGVNPGGTITVVNLGGVHVQGHVMTEHQLGDTIRNVVQFHLHNNPTSGLTPPPGRR